MTPTKTSEPVAKPMPTSQRNGQHAGYNTGKVNILLVDDRDDKLLALEAVVSSLNQNIIKARSGKEALRCLLNDEFAVILLDVAMPGMDGFETASIIRQRPQTEHTPIIFVTSMNNREANVTTGYSLGAVDYILTPIVPEVLKTKVAVFVELYKKTEHIKQQAERLRQIEEAEHRRKLAEAQDRIEAETKRNRFFTLALDMLGIADMEGRLLQVNPAWEKVLGYTEDELKAVTGFDLVHPEDRENLMTGINALKEGHSLPGFEGRFRHKDGSYRWLGGTAVPFLAEKLMYIFVRDITARKKAEEEIQSLNRQLNQRVTELTEINTELEAFSYSISHDLRAPLRSMQGFAHALYHEYGKQLDDNGKEFARRIVHSSMYMDTLLHDLLDYSRLTRSELEPTKVTLEAVVQEILAQISKDLEDRKAEVDVKKPLLAIRAHLPTTRQILSNLISNGLKFVEEGKAPKLSIWTELSGDRVKIFVRDNGIGIAEEHYRKIFNLFERLHTSREYPGTGIGLALVRKGVERMGGKAGVESRQGEGSKFWIELPAA